MGNVILLTSKGYMLNYEEYCTKILACLHVKNLSLIGLSLPYASRIESSMSQYSSMKK